MHIRRNENAFSSMKSFFCVVFVSASLYPLCQAFAIILFFLALQFRRKFFFFSMREQSPIFVTIPREEKTQSFAHLTKASRSYERRENGTQPFFSPPSLHSSMDFFCTSCAPYTSVCAETKFCFL